MPLAESVARRLRSPDYDRWMGNAAATGYCHNPVRLVGSSTTLHEPTGEVLADYASSRRAGRHHLHPLRQSSRNPLRVVQSRVQGRHVAHDHGRRRGRDEGGS